MAFYAHLKARSSGASSKGTAVQAMDYLQDDHDSRKETLLDTGEVDYIARTGPGWKTELEGGDQLPLMGFGRCSEMGQQEMRAQFEYDCVPHYKPARGPAPVTGYKSIVLALPKEVSLYAEGHRAETKAAFEASIKETLEKTYPGKNVSAVAVMHSRNDNGEVHYHVHVLVSKFAQDRESGKWGSLNYTNPYEEGTLKRSFTESFIKEYKERLNVSIEQRQDGKAILTLPDGTRLDPLNRAGRREMEKEIAPQITKVRADGGEYKKALTLGGMDQKIYEVASANKGKQGWDSEEFKKLFPKDAGRLKSYEARVETLKSVGYLNSKGRITEAFKNHAELKWGTENPQLQQLRSEVHRATINQNKKNETAEKSARLSERAKSEPNISERVGRLGITEPRLARSETIQEGRKPSFSRDELKVVALEKELASLSSKQKEALAKTGSVEDMAQVNRDFSKREAEIKSELEKTWSRIQEKRESAPKTSLEATQQKYAAMDQAIKKMEKRLESMPRLRDEALAKAKTPEEKEKIVAKYTQDHQKLGDRIQSLKSKLQDSKQADGKSVKAMPPGGAQVIQKASNALTPEEMKKAQQKLEALRPSNFKKEATRTIKPLFPEEAHKIYGGVRNAIKIGRALSNLNKAQRPVVPPHKVQELRVGIQQAIAKGGPDAALLRPWQGREQALAERTVLQATGKPSLGKETYEATIRAGQQGNRIMEATKPKPPLEVPKALEPRRLELESLNRRFEAHKMEPPFTKENLKNMTPRQLDEVLGGKALQPMKATDGGWAALSSKAVSSAHVEVAKAVTKTLEKAVGLEKSLTKPPLG